MYKEIFIIASILRFSNSATLESCPLREKEWRDREKMMKCSDGLSYHCSLDYSGNQMEFCSTRKKYAKHGCPWVLKSGEKYVLGLQLTSCINNTFCPIEGKAFYSNELYKYPACLVKEEDRQNFTLPAETPDDKDRITKRSNQNETSTGSNTVTIIATVVAVVVLGGVVVAVCLCWKRMKGEKEKNTLSPNKEQEYSRITWDLKLMIKREDNPEEVKKLYSSLKGMGEKYYKKYIKRDGNTEGSFLRYAVKMDRRGTVLFFLQRQKDGQYVFEEDTYGAKKNSSVLNAAEEKGWSDVVDLLQGIYDPETDEVISDEPKKGVRMKLLRDDADRVKTNTN